MHSSLCGTFIIYSIKTYTNDYLWQFGEEAIVASAYDIYELREKKISEGMLTTQGNLSVLETCCFCGIWQNILKAMAILLVLFLFYCGSIDNEKLSSGKAVKLIFQMHWTIA